jgi:hypothetical protein
MRFGIDPNRLLACHLSVLIDSGYTGKPFAQGVRDALGEYVTVPVAKRRELKFVHLAFLALILRRS